MVRLLQILLIITLFISCREFISIFLGKRARKIIFEKNDVNNIKLVNKRTIKGVFLFFLMFLLAILSGYNVIFALIFGFLAVGILYGLKIIKRGVIKKQVLCDLLSISECLRVQLSSHIPFGNALRTLPELCENKEFGNLLTNLYLEYELSKFVILDTKETLIERFNYSEMRIFISALNQQIQGASAIEAFDNLISILREKYIELLEDATKNKMAIMTMGVFIIVINIAAIGIYPVAVEAFCAINVILK